MLVLFLYQERGRQYQAFLALAVYPLNHFIWGSFDLPAKPFPSFQLAVEAIYVPPNDEEAAELTESRSTYSPPRSVESRQPLTLAWAIKSASINGGNLAFFLPTAMAWNSVCASWGHRTCKDEAAIHQATLKIERSITAGVDRDADLDLSLSQTNCT